MSMERAKYDMITDWIMVGMTEELALELNIINKDILIERNL